VTTSAARRARNRVVSGAVVVALAAINGTDHLLHPPWWVRALEGAALVAWARLDGLSWSQLGLGRDRLAAGCRWALGAIGVVAGVYVIGVLLPLTRPAFQDVRYDLPLGEALRTTFVVIPFGTVALEELAFRSVLWGFLSRHLRQWQVLVTTSVIFGFWHMLPALHGGGTNRGVSDAVGGAAVVLTTIGGLAFGELRRRSGSVLAGAGAHWATNALGVLFGLVAWRLDPQR
jgi:membrane protease YdiL (CAAX protease family)